MVVAEVVLIANSSLALRVGGGAHETLTVVVSVCPCSDFLRSRYLGLGKKGKAEKRVLGRKDVSSERCTVIKR